VGYHQTSNVNIPHNKRNPGTVADVAQEQLRLYQDAAMSWPVYLDGVYNRCGICEQAIWREKDDYEVSYQWTPEEITSLIVGHIRQNHEGMVSRGDV
jgi:hypothetical protein